MPPKSLSHRPRSDQSRRTPTSKSTSQIQNSSHEKNNRQPSSKLKSARSTTTPSKIINTSDTNNLNSAFTKLLNKDPKPSNATTPDQNQLHPKRTHSTPSTLLTTRNLEIPPPNRHMFSTKNPNATIYQMATIRRLYHVERDLQIELANPPDPKTLLNPAELDLGPKLDPEVQARRNAFAARYGADSPEFVKRYTKGLMIREKKSREDLARRNNTLRRDGRDVQGG